MQMYSRVIILLLCCCNFLAQQRVQAQVYILGAAQDGGYPHMGCMRQCCQKARSDSAARRFITCIAVADTLSGKWWMLEATPDIAGQLDYFRALTSGRFNYLPDGIFITHAHIGHYTGLMQLGREVMGARGVPVYVLPKLKVFLETNGPWSQLVKLGNIAVHEVVAGKAVEVNSNISFEAFTVPHRDEFSETAGFRINVKGRKYLFIPDIDKWQKWDKDILAEVQRADIALLDATFYDGNELPDLRMSEVPHPFVVETMQIFGRADSTTKAKLHFIHLNHTNPLMWDKKMQAEFIRTGYNLAIQGNVY